jgi:hypothetical protein
VRPGSQPARGQTGRGQSVCGIDAAGRSARRSWRSKWRVRVWFVLVGCVGFLSLLLAEGIFYAADFTLKFEAFAGFFIVGCVLLALSHASAKRKVKR